MNPLRRSSGGVTLLVLTRKEGEGIVIGDDVRIFVMHIKGKQVKLGIKAGPRVIIHREEVHQKIQEENKRAATVTVESLEAAMGVVEGKLSDK